MKVEPLKKNYETRRNKNFPSSFSIYLFQFSVILITLHDLIYDFPENTLHDTVSFML